MKIYRSSWFKLCQWSLLICDYLTTCNKYEVQYVRETIQRFNKRFNQHNFCFRNLTTYSFFKILNSDLSKGYGKDFSYIVSMIKSDGTGCTYRGTIDLAAKHFERLEKSIKCMNCKQIFPAVLMTGYRMNLKLKTCMLMLLLNFHVYHSGLSLFLPQQVLDNKSHILSSNIKYVFYFLRISLFTW